MKNRTSDKDLNELIAEYCRKGAIFRKGRKHGKLVLPNGRFVVVAISPSDSRRAVKNVRQRVKREMAV